jgi:hypothetical protein
MNHRSTPPEPVSAVEDFFFDDAAPRTFSAANDNSAEGPAWVWVRIRQSGTQQVWVKCEAEAAPEGLLVRAANPPKDGDDGVAIVEARKVRAQLTERKHLEHPRAADPDLLTVAEFAVAIGIAESSVFELIKKGLPSFKSLHVGRRIRRAQALIWLAEGGAHRSRIGKRLARTKKPEDSHGG